MKSKTWRFPLACHLGPIVLAAVSCREPLDPNSIRTRLSAASPSQLTGTVAHAVADPPSVTVRDASGKPVGGVVVTFIVRSGGGTIETPRVVSNSAGIASVARWTLGTVPGKNVTTAMNSFGDTVSFTADAVAGSPAQVMKLEGDRQVGSPGAALGVHPQVLVIDAYGNRLSGITVTFVVEAGGGSVSGALAVTDGSGIAESGDWVLGWPGAQRLVAQVGQLESAPFTARAVAPPLACAPSDALWMPTVVRSALTPTSCKGADGRSVQTYTIIVSATNAYVFSASSAEFDTDLELRDSSAVAVANNDNLNATTTSSEFKALLAPGTYTLVVSSPKVGATGSYSVSYRPVSTDVVGCEEAFIVRGITVRGTVDSTDCTLSPGQFADRFRIYLQAGSQVEIVVEDFSYSGPNVGVSSPDSRYTAAGPGADYPARLVYSATLDGYYTILVGLLNESGVVYELTVR